jgi:Alpha/beta hydrolase domain
MKFPVISAACAFLLSAAVAASAQVTRLEITTRTTVGGGPFGRAGAYENIRGRIYGEVDPADRRNRIIQDLALAPRNRNGKVEYVATLSLMVPVDRAEASGVLMYSVVNRGNGDASAGPEGHISLVSGWQGDVPPTASNQTIRVPVAINKDGSAVTGPVLSRFSDLPPGTNTALLQIGSMGTARYAAATLDTSKASLTFHASETVDGRTTGNGRVPDGEWAFADCRTTPFPGTPDPTRICLKNGFNPSLLYELVYTAKDPLVLGIGLAATRDIVSFFRHAKADANGVPNPVAGVITHSVAQGTSQAGNFIKTFIHLGFNEDLNGRIVWDGVFPFIAARQTPMNFRFAAPGGAATLDEPGSEPIVWWSRYSDIVRGRAAGSLLDRCTTTQTCPKVIEAFGSTEFWGLRMSPGLVGTDAAKDIPLPENVHRYYMPGTTHGGGRGGFSRVQQAAGRCELPQNPNPMADTTRALTAALVDWVVKGTEPPQSRYPTLAEGQLVTPDSTAATFRTVPGLRPVGVNPVLVYDFGPGFLANDMSGVISKQPPAITKMIPTLVPRVNRDGNETAGVASVLHQAPLGTYLGWNVQSSGFFKGQICGFTGGYVPFAVTKAERVAAGDPRPSLEERYGNQDGYMCVVRRAANELVQSRFLWREDADRTIAAAAGTKILPGAAESTSDARQIAADLCR